MEMKTSELIQNISVFVVAGRLDAATHSELMLQYEQYAINDSSHCIVDLRETTFIDSSGLSTLVKMYKEIQGDGGRMLVVRPIHPSAINILEITRFDQIFYMVDTLDDGMRLLREVSDGEA